MVEDILCFQLRCKLPIQNIDHLIDQISDQDIVSRFKYLKKKQEIINNKDKYLCPNKSCGEIIDSNNQEQVRLDLKKKLSLAQKLETIENQPIEDLDYSFLVCDHCQFVFCKICEIYHESGEATCLRRAKTNSTNILQVKFLFLWSEAKSEQQTMPQMQLDYFQRKRVQSHDLQSLQTRVLLAVFGGFHPGSLQLSEFDAVCRANVHQRGTRKRVCGVL